MIYRLRYCNKDGVEARVDIQKGSATPVIEVEGTERPFILSYNNDKSDKSGMFLSSSADIEIYETTDLDLDLNFNIDNLKTSNETELSVTHYIDNVISWQGFIIPDFFSIEVRNNPVITMTASDRLGTLKNVTLSDLPSMISLRELAILCLNKTGLELPLRTMADFDNGTGINDFFNSKILTQRLSDTKGRSISCYDILSSILTASNSFLVQRSGDWHIINKIQHEAGSGKLYTGATSFINWSDVIFNFSDISTGARRTIIPVAGSVGIYHEYGGGKLHPDNYDFSQGLTGWTPVGGFVAGIGNQSVNGYRVESGVYVPDYGEPGLNHLKNANPYQRNVNPIYLESAPIPVPYSGSGAVNIEFDINGVGPMRITTQAVMRIAIVAQKGEELLTLHHGGAFAPMPSSNPPVFEKRFKKGFTTPDFTAGADTQNMRVSGTLESSELEGWELRIRIYGGGSSNTILINAASIHMKSSQETPKGAIYKRDQGADFTKTHDIETAIFGDYLTGGLNGYFYDYPIDDTSSLYNSSNELTSKWTAYNDPEQLPLLQHVTRQKSRLFSVAHDLLSAEIEATHFDPLAIFVACEKRYTVVSAQFDFFKSNLSVELEEVAFKIANVRDYIYSYFGDGDSGIKSIGGISGGSGGGSTGGGLTPEQIEILSFWKKDPDNPNTIFTEMNAYSKLELSAYGFGDGGGGSGGGIIETVYGYGNLGQTFNNANLTDTFNAYTINQINTRLVAVESGSATTVNTTGTGNAVTSISKSGSVITANKGLTFSLTGHTHTISDITNLQTTLNNKLEASIFNTHNNDNVRHITGAERTKWDGVVTDFGNLEIGGRNYILNSKFSETVVIDSYSRMDFQFEIPEAGVYSFKCKYVIEELENNFSQIMFYNSSEYYFSIPFDSSNLTGIFSFTREFTELEAGKTYRLLTGRNLALSQGNFIRMTDIKLEKGTISTDWTPAPEDQVSDWLTTDVNSFSFIKNKPTLLSQFTDNIGVATHIANTSNPHSVTKAQVGLGNVDNTSDLNKPISNATQTALNLKLDKSVFDDLFEKVEVSTGVFAIKAKYNFYGVGEVSAYGIGSGGGSGGGGYERLDAWADYDSSKSGWVLSALLGNELNTRLVSVESGSATTVNTTGTGNAITSISKAGSVITANKGLTFSLTGHTHNISDITNLQTTLNNKLETSIFNTHNNDNVRHITGAERTKWDGVVTDFGNLEIGGANLFSIVNNGNWHKMWMNTSSSIAVASDSAMFFIPITKGGKYTINGDLGDTTLCRTGYVKGDVGIPQTAYNTDRNTLLPRTLEIDNDATYFIIQVAQSIADEFKKSLMFEKGNKATDWTPAPEDQVSDWNTTDVNSFSFIKNKPTLLSQFTDDIGVAGHIANKSNPHSVTKAQVGLGNVDNTADSSKNVLSATRLTTARTINGTSFDGSTNIITANWGTARNISIGGTAKSVNGSANVTWATSEIAAQTAVTLATARSIGLSGVTATAQSFNGSANITIPITAVPASLITGTLSNNTTGSAATLTTSRNIWGRPFNGSANVTGAMTGVTSITMSAALTGATTIDASTRVTSPRVNLGNNWEFVAVGTETQLQYNGVVKMRLTEDGLFEITGDIVSTGEVTAFN